MKADIFGLDTGAKQMERRLKGWSKSVEKRAEMAMTRIGLRWHAGMVERVPVDEGTLKERLLVNTYLEKGVWITEAGSNLKYAVFVEFGTDYIAAGNVKALGMGPEITDAQAITVWQAKNAGIIKTGGVADANVLAAIEANLKAGGRQEQMPWLRPAFNAIRKWVEKEMAKALEIPKGDAA